MKRTAIIDAAVLSEPEGVIGRASGGAPDLAAANLPRPTAEPRS
jgi:hypothetical protein